MGPEGIIGTMDPAPEVYEERFRWTWPAAGAAAAGAGFIALMLAVRAPLVLRVLTIGVFGWFAIVTVAAVLTRRVAFRADAAGLTLGGSPFRYAATTRVFPWPEVDAVHERRPARASQPVRGRVPVRSRYASRGRHGHVRRSVLVGCR